MTQRAATEESYHTGRAIHLASVAALGGFLFGFDTAVIDVAVGAVREDFEMGSFLTGFAVASALLAARSGREEQVNSSTATDGSGSWCRQRCFS